MIKVTVLKNLDIRYVEAESVIVYYKTNNPKVECVTEDEIIYGVLMHNYGDKSFIIKELATMKTKVEVGL